MSYFIDFWRKHRNEYKALFFDIDGTLISGPNCLAGTNQLLADLYATEVPFLLLTNDSNNSLEEKSGLLKRCGVDIPASKIISAGTPLKEWVEKRELQGTLFFQMGDLGNPSFAIEAGLVTTNDINKIDDCLGVLVGEGIYNWHEVFYEVFNFFLRHKDSRYLISPSPDICWAGGRNGGLGIGAGAVAEALQLWLKHQNVIIEPIFLGKPYPDIYKFALERLGLSDSPKQAIMLGDSLRSDIAGANRCGITSALLLTGITTEEMLAQAPADLKPDLCFTALAPGE